jgi:hypothetical protein
VSAPACAMLGSHSTLQGQTRKMWDGLPLYRGRGEVVRAGWHSSPNQGLELTASRVRSYLAP